MSQAAYYILCRLRPKSLLGQEKIINVSEWITHFRL